MLADEVFFLCNLVVSGEIVAVLRPADDEFLLLLKRFLPREICVVSLADCCVVVSMLLGVIVGRNEVAGVVVGSVAFVGLIRSFFGVHFSTGLSEGLKSL